MKFTTAKEHRDFFQKQGWIEFEDLISSEQITAIQQQVEQTVMSRLPRSHMSLEEGYMQGHDLWRSNSLLRKWATHPKLAQIASELIEKKPLRLGYDQFFPSSLKQGQSIHKVSCKTPLSLKEIASLEEVSSIDGISCGLMLCLKVADDHNEKTLPPEGINVFPSTQGHVIFFRPTYPVNWGSLFDYPNRAFYLITFTCENAYYEANPYDPHTHA
jgi:hypothetical protein